MKEYLEKRLLKMPDIKLFKGDALEILKQGKECRFNLRRPTV